METSRRRHACTKVTLNGRPGLVVSGGNSLSSGHHHTHPRRVLLVLQEHGHHHHACMLILGGVSTSSKNLTSVEFYDSASGQWASLPNLQRGRRNHAMLVHNGRLTVTGGVQVRILTDWPDPLCPG